MARLVVSIDSGFKSSSHLHRLNILADADNHASPVSMKVALVKL
jgi:hypothetical protein